MGSPLDQFMAAIKKADTSELANQAVDQLLTDTPPQELVNTLIEVAQSEGLNDEMLGYFILPGLKRIILKRIQEKYPDPLAEVIALVKNSEVPQKLVLHCIDYLSNFFRKGYAIDPSEFVDLVRDIACDFHLPLAVRTRTARLLAKLPPRDQKAILKPLIDSREPPLITAACSALCRWPGGDLVQAGELIDPLIDFVKQSPAAAVQSPNILRTLARIDTEESHKAFAALVEKDWEDDDWVRLATCIAPNSAFAPLLRTIQGVLKIKGPRKGEATRSLMRRIPGLAESLHEQARYRELLGVLKLEPTAMDKSPLPFIEKIPTNIDADTSKMAEELKRDFKSARCTAFLSKEDIQAWKEKQLDDLQQPPPPPPAIKRDSTDQGRRYGEYCTGLNMGNAIYRDTYLIDPTCHNHWHAAVFQAFEFTHEDDGVEGHMRGVHMTGFPGAVQPFAASSCGFNNPNIDVAVQMHDLYDAFLKAFKVDDDHKFHGARQTASTGKSERLCLLQASEDLMSYDIQYVFADMLDWKGSHWSGTAADIDNLRCDGVVEYIYESCGEQVCAGTQADCWNIAAEGNQYPESHADLHTLELDRGELCPRVQAGDEGNDTTFIRAERSAPAIKAFSVHEEANNVVALAFNVESKNYYSVYVRLLAGPMGGPFDFVTSGAVGPAEGLSGTWCFKEVDEGTNHFAWCPKHTLPGHNASSNQPLEFRLVAVDKGGNVSAEHYCRLAP